jgi:hypothetical protein
MRFFEDYSDERLRAWCIHCGAVIENVPANNDHVPSKCLLSKEFRANGAKFDRGIGDADAYLPQILICKKCNADFSRDESYMLCVLHAVQAGTLYPDPAKFPDAAQVLRSNRDVVRSLKNDSFGQMPLFDDLQPFTIYPDADRIRRVIVKNAKGHAYHEISEPLRESPTLVSFAPIISMTDDAREAFERGCVDKLDVWPEVGSRMMLRLTDGPEVIGGWVVVEPGRYRYSIDWSSGVTVRTVIWEYLATETCWEE